MTEYWVSQGNKWCDFCKIYIANNPSSIRNHDLGKRHKDNVAKKLTDMRKEKAAKEKAEKEAARAIEQIEAKANRSYQKDVAAFKEVRQTNTQALDATYDDSKVSALPGGGWEYDSSTGYYYNQNGLYYDPNSGFYFSDAIGKWVTQDEVFAASEVPSSAAQKGPIIKKPLPVSEANKVMNDKAAAKSSNAPGPGRVVSGSLNPMRSVKGASSSLTINKRKRENEKPKTMSAEEAAALKAREAAKKRVEAREKPYLGLYGSR
ncbi:OCRE domain [Dillenia turbinata]|uniref:OCRE domain n=1 Tax=Dillenia turbinata TaxID=194707 RepID=A0AAN8W4X7_9MAGN